MLLFSHTTLLVLMLPLVFSLLVSLLKILASLQSEVGADPHYSNLSYPFDSSSSLHPGDYPHPLECDLIRTSLVNPLNYKRLSYAWGVPDLVSQIRVNGHELRILALRHIRLKDSPRLLWTDAICINQASVPERSS